MATHSGCCLENSVDRGACLQCGRLGFDPRVGKIPWRRKWQPTPVFLPGKSHRQRSLVAYSPRGRKELDMTEQFHSLSLTQEPGGLQAHGVAKSQTQLSMHACMFYSTVQTNLEN